MWLVLFVLGYYWVCYVVFKDYCDIDSGNIIYVIGFFVECNVGFISSGVVIGFGVFKFNILKFIVVMCGIE